MDFEFIDEYEDDVECKSHESCRDWLKARFENDIECQNGWTLQDGMVTFSGLSGTLSDVINLALCDTKFKWLDDLTGFPIAPNLPDEYSPNYYG